MTKTDTHTIVNRIVFRAAQMHPGNDRINSTEFAEELSLMIDAVNEVTLYYIERFKLEGITINSFLRVIESTEKNTLATLSQFPYADMRDIANLNFKLVYQAAGDEIRKSVLSELISSVKEIQVDCENAKKSNDKLMRLADRKLESLNSDLPDNISSLLEKFYGEAYSYINAKMQFFLTTDRIIKKISTKVEISLANYIAHSNKDMILSYIQEKLSEAKPEMMFMVIYAMVSEGIIDRKALEPGNVAKFFRSLQSALPLNNSTRQGFTDYKNKYQYTISDDPLYRKVVTDLNAFTKTLQA